MSNDQGLYLQSTDGPPPTYTEGETDVALQRLEKFFAQWAERCSDRALEQRARRAARRAGFLMVKSRARESMNNRGGYMLVNKATNIVEWGEHFELSDQQVIDYCNGPK